jgi:hypothetical protein
MRVVIALANVELDRHLLPGLDDVVESRSFDQLLGSG